MTTAGARRAENLVLILTIASMLVVLIYDRSPYREKIIQKSEKKRDWQTIKSVVELGTTVDKNDLLDYFSLTNETSCKRIHLMGGTTGQFLCLDPSVIPRTSCLVYSFDFFHDFYFENEMRDYFCKIHNFDPINLGNFTGLDDLIDAKLSGKKSSRNYNKRYSGAIPKTSKSIYRVIKHLLDNDPYKIVDYLKLDLEGEEWEVIPLMLDSRLFSQIRQLGVEIHLFEDDLEYYRVLVGKIQALEHIGMVRFHSKETTCSYSGLREKWPEDNNIALPLKCFEMAWYQILPSL